MKQLMLGAIGLLLAAALAAAPGEQILLKARDLEGNPLSGLRFSYDQVKSKKTNRSGITELDLPPKRPPGQQIKVELVPSSKSAKDWFLVSSLINIPTDADRAEVVLMRRSTFRQIAARRALEIDEKRFGLEDIFVAIDLNNLTRLRLRPTSCRYSQRPWYLQ